MALRPPAQEAPIDEEPPFFYRRLGELTFGRGGGADGTTRPRPALASSPAAGLFAYSDGQGKREKVVQ